MVASQTDKGVLSGSRQVADGGNKGGDTDDGKRVVEVNHKLWVSGQRYLALYHEDR